MMKKNEEEVKVLILLIDIDISVIDDIEFNNSATTPSTKAFLTCDFYLHSNSQLLSISENR